jgi:hypothetical protein
MTLECSKCHDHKYDPLSQKNYYQLFSFFNNVNEAGQISWDDALPVPTLQLPTAQQQAIVKYIQTKLNTTIQNKAYPAKINAEFNQWIRSQQYQQDLTSPILLAYKDIIRSMTLYSTFVTKPTNPKWHVMWGHR